MSPAQREYTAFMAMCFRMGSEEKAIKAVIFACRNYPEDREMAIKAYLTAKTWARR